VFFARVVGSQQDDLSLPATHDFSFVQSPCPEACPGGNRASPPSPNAAEFLKFVDASNSVHRLYAVNHAALGWRRDTEHLLTDTMRGFHLENFIGGKFSPKGGHDQMKKRCGFYSVRGWLKSLGGSWRVRGKASPTPSIDETLA